MARWVFNLNISRNVSVNSRFQKCGRDGHVFQGTFLYRLKTYLTSAVVHLLTLRHLYEL